MSARKRDMMFLRWLSMLAAAVALVGVIVGNVRGFRISDPTILRRQARRLGWGVLGAFVYAVVVYSISMVASLGAVAAVRPDAQTISQSGPDSVQHELLV